MSPAAKQRRNKGIASARTGMSFSEEHKDRIAKVAQRNWEGGQTGDDLNKLVAPAGFVREHRIHYGEPCIRTGFGLRRKSFNLDFAHVEGRVNIELDGPCHKSLPAADEERDAILRNLGWRVIRIKHV